MIPSNIFSFFSRTFYNSSSFQDGQSVLLLRLLKFFLRNMQLALGEKQTNKQTHTKNSADKFTVNKYIWMRNIIMALYFKCSDCGGVGELD